MSKNNRIIKYILFITLNACIGTKAISAINISDSPLFLTVDVAPNVSITMDDSGSMGWGYVPDAFRSDQSRLDGPRFKAASQNPIYYNPKVTYSIPTRKDGVQYITSYTQAYVNGFNRSLGYMDLSNRNSVSSPNKKGYRPIAEYFNNKAEDCNVAATTGHNTSKCRVTESQKSTKATYHPAVTVHHEALTVYHPAVVIQHPDEVKYHDAVIVQHPDEITNYVLTCKIKFDHKNNNDRIDISDCASSGKFTNGVNISAGDIVTFSNTGNSAFNKSITVAAVDSSTRISTNYNFTSDYTTANSNAKLSIAHVTKSAWDETVTAAWTEVIKPAWTETIPAYTEIASAAWDETIPAWSEVKDEDILVGYYTMYYADKSGATKPSGCDNKTTTDACYITISVGTADDVYPGTPAQQLQNFANWYSFYRTRNLASITAAMTAITNIKTNEVRLGWQSLNSCKSFGESCKGYDDINRENRIRFIDGNSTVNSSATHRTDYYNWLQRLPANGGTPLRGALQRAGEYFKLDGKNSPYAEDPYISKGTELSCRKNFNILFTDGLWNGDSNIFGGNVDNTNKTLPDNIEYTPRVPYNDSHADSLADIAFNYWSTDLRTDLDNNVAPYYIDRSGNSTAQYWNAKNNPATWQHMVNFTIGLGLTSSLDGTIPSGSSSTNPIWAGGTYLGATGYLGVLDGSKSWPSLSTEASHVYDLWHSAINSRGQFFSADTPETLNAAFQSVLDSILASNPSSAALAANSTSVQTGALVYQARFDSADWHGQLLAFPVQGDGSIGSQQWDASTLLPSSSARKIFTINAGVGTEFTSCDNLSASARLALNTNNLGVDDSRCTDRLNWIRGDSSKEERNYNPSTNSNANLRSRNVSVLGDIVNSDPAYSKNEDFGYGSAESALSASQKTTYSSYLASKSTRTPVVYVGANDGMLHAFRADIGNTNSGKELFAYIPSGVYQNLSSLTSPVYSHKPFVDGPPTVGDAYISGSWSTYLVGGLGAGGKSIYALDVTNPDVFSASNVKWEFFDANDLGYTFSQPGIARMNNGEWVAIFGNGYNSTSNSAYLYVVNLSDGTLIRKIPVGSAIGNGLSTPYLYDSNGDMIIDYVYAGDLQGNMWKFDMSSSDSASWGVANSNLPLFTAVNEQNFVQPITSQPKVAKHPQGGEMVYFGTGIYLSSEDVLNTQVQSFYGIWDNGFNSTISRSLLQQQTITAEVDEFGYSLRETSNNAVDWITQRGWYMNLKTPPLPGVAKGERVVSTPLLKYDRVIFVTMAPSQDPCIPGGTSWIMELDALGGARLVISAFDFNNDDKFDTNDLLTSGKTASGVKSTVGITKTPVYLTGNAGKDWKELSGTSGNIMSLGQKGMPPSGAAPVQIYWRQLL